MLDIAFIWEWERAKEIEPNWRDGLRACLEELAKNNRVDWLLYETPKKDYDWIITWCDSNSNFSHFFTPQYKAKRGIFLTTNPTNYHNLQGFDVVFCESSVVLEECRRWGIHAVKAFGTDTEFFKPKKVKKDIEYFYPATFSPWKRQATISYLGSKLTCVGTIQPDGMGEYGACIEHGVKCEVGYFPPEKIRDYYQRTQSIIIPAVHGSERTVLEAMSCNILPEVINDANEKSQTYLQEYARSECKTPREFVKKYYSGKTYAQSVLKGLNESD
jgi:glycosyltransferase involved in cell wall biosynthesis